VGDDRGGQLVRDGLAVVAVALAAVCAVVLVLPGEGLVAAPLHAALAYLLGDAAFILPLALLLAGVLTLVRSARPETRLPYPRLVGVTLMALAAAGTKNSRGRRGTADVGRS
jgi:hypothetical protein